MGLIFRPRQPRHFNHIPIYWDPKKEQLKQRVEQIRLELGSNESQVDLGTSKKLNDIVTHSPSAEDLRETLSNSLFSGTRHLKRQRDRGIDSYARTGIILRSILILLLLGFIVWVLYYRQGPLLFL